jgi:cardiolipin synthase
VTDLGAARLPSRHHVDRLLRQRVQTTDLAVAFDWTTTSSAEVLVDGTSFYPPMLADIEAATSSVHINQFGFRPGQIGERFADTLLAKTSEGIPVRLIVDRLGTDPDRSSRDFYRRLLAGGIEVGVVRAAQPRAPAGLLGAGGRPRWNLGQLGHVDHRKVVVVDGRIGWVGGAGIEDHFHDGRFHDLFVRLIGDVASQLQLVFLTSWRWLGGSISSDELEDLLPDHGSARGGAPAIVLHNAPGRYRPITMAIAELLEGARETLDVVNPYVTDRRMIGRIADAARRGVRVRLFVPAEANNWACAAAQQWHHASLLRAGVRILEYPTMLHAKAFVRDSKDVIVGTCNLEAWSLRRFFEIDVRVRSRELAGQFEDRFSRPAEAVSRPGRALSGTRERAKAAAFAAISPLL